MKIYVDTPFYEKQKAMLRSSVTDDMLEFKDEIAGEEQQLKALLGADILLGNPKPVEWLQQAVNLKWVQLYSAGFEYYKSIKIPAVVTNMKDYYSQPCAETIVAGILALYRGMDTFTLLKSEKKWVGYTARNELRLLREKKIIILGAGAIAKRIAKILSGFDCTVSFYARTAEEASIHSPAELLDAIPNADIIIGCLPGTNETKGLFTAEMIGKMKSDSIFCNVGRGNLLADEQALIDALNNKKIGGAVLDVTAQEPIPADHSLWDCPNTILSQHSGGGNITEYEGIAELFLENLKQFKAGKPLKNIIQLEKGY